MIWIYTQDYTNALLCMAGQQSRIQENPPTKVQLTVASTSCNPGGSKISKDFCAAQMPPKAINFIILKYREIALVPSGRPTMCVKKGSGLDKTH